MAHGILAHLLGASLVFWALGSKFAATIHNKGAAKHTMCLYLLFTLFILIALLCQTMKKYCWKWSFCHLFDASKYKYEV